MVKETVENEMPSKKTQKSHKTSIKKKVIYKRCCNEYIYIKEKSLLKVDARKAVLKISPG